MNYKAAYDNLIFTRKFSNRKKDEGVYYESHHILPRCLGGTNKKDNLILFTAEEHFIAHLLLTKMYEGEAKRKMQYAFWEMCNPRKYNHRIVSASQYALGREMLSLAMTGRIVTDETKKRLSKSHLGRTAWNKGKKVCMSESARKAIRFSNMNRIVSNETKEKMSNVRKGKKLSDEHKRKLSETSKGKSKSDETKKKMSEAKKGNKNLLGYKFSDETKKKMSKSHLGQTAWNKGKKDCITTEGKNAISISNKNRIVSNETKEKMSNARKLYHKNKNNING